MPGGIEETVRNLREISPTVYFNVPKGYESLLPYLRDDKALRAKFFAPAARDVLLGRGAVALCLEQPRRTRGAGDRLSRADADRPRRHRDRAVLHVGQPATSRSGHVGLPVSGNDAKLVPNNGKLEVRAKGPNVTPGYWRQPELTAAAFDEEGFYKFGDALKPVDPNDFDAGFDFDGRIAEDFKLASGTWVSVGPLRARFVAACAPLVRDVVIAGINRDEMSALVDPRSRRLPPDQSDAAVRRSCRDRGRSADPRRLSRAVCEVSGDRDRLVDADHPRDPARYAAVDRSRRGHRQGLDQPARGAGASRRTDRRALFADAGGARDSALAYENNLPGRKPCS